MSSGVVNPLATDTNSTWSVGGGGGGIWFEVPPPQPATAIIVTPHRIAAQARLLDRKSDMTPPGWYLHSARTSYEGSRTLPHPCVNILQNLAMSFAYPLHHISFAAVSTLTARVPVLWQNRVLQERVYGPQNDSRRRTPRENRARREEALGQRNQALQIGRARLRPFPPLGLA